MPAKRACRNFSFCTLRPLHTDTAQASMLSPRAIKKSSAVLKKHTFLLSAKYNIESLCKSIEQLFTGVFAFLRYLCTCPPLFCPARSKAPFQLTKENKSYRIYQVSILFWTLSSAKAENTKMVKCAILLSEAHIVCTHTYGSGQYSEHYRWVMNFNLDK